MSLDDPSEIERLRLELKKITADRDHLLVENRRLTQTSQVKKPRATTNELVEEVASSINATKKFDSISLLIVSWLWLKRYGYTVLYFTDAKMSTQFFGK